MKILTVTVVAIVVAVSGLLISLQSGSIAGVIVFAICILTNLGLVITFCSPAKGRHIICADDSAVPEVRPTPGSYRPPLPPKYPTPPDPPVISKRAGGVHWL